MWSFKLTMTGKIMAATVDFRIQSRARQRIWAKTLHIHPVLYTHLIYCDSYIINQGCPTFLTVSVQLSSFPSTNTANKPGFTAHELSWGVLVQQILPNCALILQDWNWAFHYTQTQPGWMWTGELGGGGHGASRSDLAGVLLASEIASSDPWTTHTH